MSEVNVEEVDWERSERGETLIKRKNLAAPAGGELIGTSLYELPAGRRSYPYHYHTANEEALFVLAGTGAIRLEDGILTLESGDYVALPPGEGSAHRVVNDGDGTLRYLMISTMRDPDVIVYPDSEKVGVYTGGAPGRDGAQDRQQYFREGTAVDYWHGEEEDAAGE
ncbi:MAG: cupin domain-containing protein [Halodesulfurarchaeum sp.]